MIIKLTEGPLETRFGTFTEKLYYNGQKEAIGLVMGDVKQGEEVLCRVHSSCISAHILNSIECDCREQMEMAQLRIQEAGRGVIIWLDQEGRANGHVALLASAQLRADGLTQSEAYTSLGYEVDDRNYKVAAEILEDLGVKSITLMTNNPHKIEALSEAGINIAGTQRVVLSPNKNNDKILYQTYTEKISRGHHIELEA